ncbi:MULTISPECIES: hypothetical protein [unclassified Rhizobium]|uniref:STY1053 family phage-associated protein n=1 Tax=unclassified Rhizobium TaxID=2613769 RepID=UPI0037FE15EE
MPKINVATPFNLRKDNGEQISFEPGEQVVSKEIAEHWFVKAHLVGATYEPKEGSYEFVRRSRAEKAEADAAAAEQQADADAAAQAETDARIAASLARTDQAIAQGAQQAYAIATKDEPKPTDAVTDLPPIPLASGAPAGEASQTATEGAEQQQAAGEGQAGQPSQGEAGANDGEKSAEQQAE